MHRILFAAILLGAGQAPAQRLDVAVSVDSARIGERFLLTVSALHGFSEEPQFPDQGADFGDLEDVRTVSQGHVITGMSARFDSIVFDVTTFSLDSAVVLPLGVTLHGGTRRDSTPRLVIPVASVVPADADTIRGMAEAVFFEEPRMKSMPPWPWVLLGIAVLATTGGLWYWYTRRRTQVVLGEAQEGPVRSPYELAMDRLGALEQADLTAKGSEEPYFVELSETLRMYLEQRIGVPALEMTTGEVLREFALIRYKIPGGVPDEVQRVLGLSDLVKFAEFTPPGHESRTTLTEARHVIEQLEAKQRQLALDAARQAENQS